MLYDQYWGNGQLSVDPDLVKDLLLQLNPYTSMGPDGINQKIFKELSDVTAKPLLMTCDGLGKSSQLTCLPNLISFYNMVTHLLDLRKASRCHIFRLQQSFWYRFSHSISLDQVSTFSWIAVTQSVSNQLTSQAERVLVNEVTSGWQLVTGGVLHSSIFNPVLFNIFINALDTGPGGILSLPKASHWGELSNP